jgi:hypothetical protein
MTASTTAKFALERLQVLIQKGEIPLAEVPSRRDPT